MRCQRCGCELEPEDAQHHAGQPVCEDCYFDLVNRPNPCDPWAVHLAKSTRSQEGLTLTPVQQKLYDLVKERGRILIPEAARLLGLTEAELQREFATLRHLELLRGHKDGQQIYLTLF